MNGSRLDETPQVFTHGPQGRITSNWLPSLRKQNLLGGVQNGTFNESKKFPVIPFDHWAGSMVRA